MRNQDTKTMLYILAVTAIPALILAGMIIALRPIHTENEAIYNKKQILSSLNDPLGIKAEGLSGDQVNDYFNNIEQIVIDAQGSIVADYSQKAEEISLEQEEKKAASDRKYPVFVYTNSGKKYYILSVRGNGLWDKIWGWVALEQDLTTVAGAAFGHKGETPGLGAEITDNSSWKAQFIGKKIYDTNSNFTSVIVRKGGARLDNIAHEVDGISGATITCDGVSKMLSSGIGIYRPYLESLKKS